MEYGYNMKVKQKPKIKKNKISLKEKFLKYKGENLAKNFSWDNPKGKEIL